MLAADLCALIGQTTLANHNVSLATQFKITGCLKRVLFSFESENIISLSGDTHSKLLIYSGSFKRAIITADYAGLCFVCLCKCSGDYLGRLR